MKNIKLANMKIWLRINTIPSSIEMRSCKYFEVLLNFDGGTEKGKCLSSFANAVLMSTIKRNIYKKLNTISTLCTLNMMIALHRNNTGNKKLI